MVTAKIGNSHLNKIALTLISKTFDHKRIFFHCDSFGHFGLNWEKEYAKQWEFSRQVHQRKKETQTQKKDLLISPISIE